MKIDEFVGFSRRWPVLDVLRAGPLDRRDLQEQVGVSRPTIHRQLRALRDAGLVTKRNGTFTLTPVGKIAATEFSRTFEIMDTVSTLGQILPWLPVPEFDFEFDRLRDAEVTLPGRTDPFAPTRRMLQTIHEADHIRMVTYTFLPEGDPADRRCFVEEGQSFEGVLDSTLVRSLSEDPASADHLRELLSRGMRISIAPEPVPLVLTIADEQVIIGAVDDDGSPRGLIVTDDEVIRAWAEETVDDYLARAEQLTPKAIDTRVVAADGGG
ncbi:helix-turn-helix transcriptional regulator [Salinigranum marinum]|uniref:helix-turn-helix transcriptional regulator n=1 Tax=Salinigranum marinum TaxID=1515595 RepID=UPI002989CB4B|nr:ArsR family transcriptional regulator [Salinigranum marinum]